MLGPPGSGLAGVAGAGLGQCSAPSHVPPKSAQFGLLGEHGPGCDVGREVVDDVGAHDDVLVVVVGVVDDPEDVLGVVAPPEQPATNSMAAMGPIRAGATPTHTPPRTRLRSLTW